MSSGVSYDITEHLGMLATRKTAKGPDCQSILQPPSRASCMAQHARVRPHWAHGEASHGSVSTSIATDWSLEYHFLYSCQPHK
jgi:hypothetical protein